MIRSAHIFTGRDSELERLRHAWQIAKDGRPQIVALVSEPGFGKTRIVQAFYSLLAQEARRRGDSYWPADLSRYGNNLDINPDPSRCEGNIIETSFLWWGLRVPDLGRRNLSAIGALRPAEAYLRAHLAAYEQSAELRDRRQRFARAGANGATDLALGLLGGLPAIAAYAGVAGVGKSIFQIAALFAKYRAETRRLKNGIPLPVDVKVVQDRNLVDAIIEDLRVAAHSPPDPLKPLPLIVVVDDVQWMRDDETLTDLVAELLQSASNQGWPLLMIITCWRQEWYGVGGRIGVEGHFAKLGVPVGQIDVGPERTLGKVVRAAFPGLSPIQEDLILDRVEGHPGFLDELLRLLDNSHGLFVDRSVDRALTPQGVKVVKDISPQMIVSERLRSAPRSVQIALGLAALQGPIFSPAVVLGAAANLAISDCARGLREGEDVLGFICPSEFEGVEFRTRAAFEAARENLANVLDCERATDAIWEALSELRPVLGHEAAHRDLEAQLSLLDVEDVKKRDVAFAALAALIADASARLDTKLAGKLARQWSAAWKRNPNATAKYGDLLVVAAALVDAASITDALELLMPVLDRWNREPPTARDVVGIYGSMLSIAGLAISARDGRGAACPLFQRAVEILGSVAEGGDDDSLRFAIALETLGGALCHLEGMYPALSRYEEAIAVARGIATPSDPRAVKIFLARVLNRIGFLNQQAGEYQKAIPFYAEALVVGENLLKTHPVPEVQQLCADSHAGLASLQSLEQVSEDSLDHFAKAYQLMAGLARALRTETARRAEAVALSQLGNAVKALRGPAEAFPFLAASLAIHDGLKGNEASAEDIVNQAIALINIAEIFHASGRQDEALERLYRATYLTSSVQRQDQSLYAQQQAIAAIIEAVRAFLKIKATAATLNVARTCEAAARRLADLLVTPHARSQHSRALTALGSVLVKVEGSEAGFPVYLEALEIGAAVFRAAPNARSESDYLNALFKVGCTAFDLGKRDISRCRLTRFVNAMEGRVGIANWEALVTVSIAHAHLQHLALRRGAIVSVVRHTLARYKVLSRIVTIHRSHGWSDRRALGALRGGNISMLYEAHALPFKLPGPD